MSEATIEAHTIFIERFKPTDPRLGRHVRHDSRSLNYQVEAQSLDTLKSIRHPRHIPILDQGQLGSCTGNAATGCLGSGQFFTTVQNLLSQTDATLDETYALGVYSDATKLDPYAGTYPPTDTGSDGLSVAKVLLSRKLIAGYQHATSLQATLTALAKQPVIVGTKWTANMFNPAGDGKLNISGTTEGGHEYELDELDVENRRVWMDNSWTVEWGVQGRAYMTWDDLGALLADNGDCTVFVPNTQPAPTPTPPQPTPTDPKAEFAKAYATFKAATDKFLQ